MKRIKEKAFLECTSLKHIEIPNSVTSIEENVFSQCRSLSDVYFTGSEEEWFNIAFSGGNNILQKVTIHFDSHMPEIDEPHEYSLMGDVNGDGKVTAKDSMTVQRYAIKLDQLSDEQLKAADVDKDGKTTSKDALYILRYSINLAQLP